MTLEIASVRRRTEVGSLQPRLRPRQQQQQQTTEGRNESEADYSDTNRQPPGLCAFPGDAGLEGGRTKAHRWKRKVPKTAVGLNFSEHRGGNPLPLAAARLRRGALLCNEERFEECRGSADCDWGGMVKAELVVADTVRVAVGEKGFHQELRSVSCFA